jgi:hypothetical protein
MKVRQEKVSKENKHIHSFIIYAAHVVLLRRLFLLRCGGPDVVETKNQAIECGYEILAENLKEKYQ